MRRKIHNWLLRQRWLWRHKHTVNKTPNMKGDRMITRENWEWEHYILGYVTMSNHPRSFADIWKPFYEKRKA